MSYNKFFINHKDDIESHLLDINYKEIYVGENKNLVRQNIEFVNHWILPEYADKNYTYCEMTGFFAINELIGKNDIIEINHYRRFFVRKNILTKSHVKPNELKKQLIKYGPKIKKCENEIYVLRPVKLLMSNEENFYLRHGQKLRKILNPLFGKSDTFRIDEFLTSNEFIPYNMIICKGDVFNELVKFQKESLSKIFESIEIPKDNYQRRILGFLSERLFNIWLKSREEKINHLEYVFVDKSNIYLYYSLLKRKLKNLIFKWKKRSL